MKKQKVFYTKRLMRNTTSVISILVAVFLIFGSTISAVDLSTENNEINSSGEEKILQEKAFGPVDGLAPVDLVTDIASSPTNSIDMEQGLRKAPTSFGETMYGYTAALGPHGEGPCYFDIEDPTDIIQLSTETLPNFAAGGTYTCDYKWLVVEYSNGALYEIDPEDGVITTIGGGGGGLNGCALDPATNTLFGAGSYGLYTIDPEDGTQEYVGDFGSGQTHIGIACNSEGIMYSWDVKFSGNSYLYEIDKETGEAENLGSLGKTLLYAQDGDFWREEGVLYLTAYIANPESGGYLCTVDVDEVTLEIVDRFENGAEVTGSMLMNACVPKEHDVGVKEILSPQDGYATGDIEMKVLVKNYGNNSETTDVQFEIIKCEAGPLIAEEYFDGTFPPTGWSTDHWRKSYTNEAGGESSPEARVYKYYQYPDYYDNYIRSAPTNASGYEKVNVKFAWSADLYYPQYCYFDVKYRKNATTGWRTVTPWENPLGENKDPLKYEIGCYGWGEDIGSEFQVEFAYSGYYYYYNNFYLDDFQLEGCAGCAEYAELVEDVEVPWGEEVEVTFPSWTPSEWQNPDFQDTWEGFPMTAYTVMTDNNSRNDKKQRLLNLYFPFLHDVGAFTFEGPESGPAQTFPVTTMVKNVGQYDECCFKTHVQIGLVDFDNPVELMTESFSSSYPWPPEGWDRSHTNWIYGYSSRAGGSYGELRFYRYPSVYNPLGFRFIYGPIDTTDMGGVNIEFKHFYDYYYRYTDIALETSPDGKSWDTIWFENPSSDMGPETLSFDTTDNVGGDFYIAFTVYRYSYYTYGWYIDDVKVEGYPVSEPEYTDEVCIDEIVPGEEITLEFDDWTPEFLAEEESGQLLYLAKAWTDMYDPEDNNPANDAYAISFYLDYWHDVGVQQFASPIGGRGQEVKWDNGVPDGRNGVSVGEWPGTFEREVADDFTVDGAGWDILGGRMRLVTYYSATSIDEGKCFFYADDGDEPSTEVYAEVEWEVIDDFLSGDYYFSRPEIVVDVNWSEEVVLTPGKWWVVFYPIINDNPFWLTTGGSGESVYCAYPDLGYPKWTPGINVFGDNYDVCFKLFGTDSIGPPSPDVYIQPGVESLEAILENLGTFTEDDLTAYAEIWQYFDDWENGTVDAEYNITGITMEPLGDTEDVTFGTYDFYTEGIFKFQIELPLENDDYPKNNDDYWGVGVDDTKPESEHTLDPADPNGLEGYYISDVEVTLDAEDPIGVHGTSSGVDFCEYRVNGGSWIQVANHGTFTLTQDGNDILVEYRATDMVGNVEATNDFEISIDQTLPEIEEVEWEAEKIEGEWWVHFTCTATDATASMDRVELEINDGLWDTITDEGPTYVFDMEWSSALEKVTFTFIHYDDAGWFIEDELFGGDIVAYIYAQSDSQQSNQKQANPA
jgi:hypothetical protein